MHLDIYISNKKGISAIVATVLIILITVAAVTIIWAAIIPLVSNQLEESRVCLDATSSLSLPDKGYSCSGPFTSVVQISRNSVNVGIEDIQVVFNFEGTSFSYRLLNSLDLLTPPGIGIAPLNTPNVNVTQVLGLNEVQSYLAYTPSYVDSISIAPVVGIGNKEVICDVAQTLSLKNCT